MATSYAELNPDERLALAERHKARGNALFQSGRHDAAMLNYNRALAYCLLPGSIATAATTVADWSAEPRLDRLGRLLRLNMAGLQLAARPANPACAVVNCSAALEGHSSGPKAQQVLLLLFLLQKRYVHVYAETLFLHI